MDLMIILLNTSLKLGDLAWQFQINCWTNLDEILAEHAKQLQQFNFINAMSETYNIYEDQIISIN